MFRGGTFKEILFNIYSDLTKDLESKKTDLENYVNGTVIQNAKDGVDVYLTDTSKPDLDTYTTTKKSEINSHTTTKIGEVTSHTTTKEAEITSYTDTKKAEITSYTDSKISEITSHTDTKKTELDSYKQTQEGELESYTTTKKNELEGYKDDKIQEIIEGTGMVSSTSVTNDYTGSSSSLVPSQKALYDGLGTKENVFTKNSGYNKAKSDSVSLDDSDTLGTSKAVKTAYDKGLEALSTANTKQPSGTYNTIIGTNTDIDTSGATIIDNIYVTDGVITSMGTRTLTASDIGALSSTGLTSIVLNGVTMTVEV